MKRNSNNGLPVRSFKCPVSRQFKSPLGRSNADSSKDSYADLIAQVDALRKRLQETNAEVEILETAGYKETELQAHIDKMHEYNEVKDVGQMVLGRIAVLEGIQSKDLYERYGLNLND